MAISNDLFRAILAMDSYNSGNNASVRLSDPKSVEKVDPLVFWEISGADVK